MQSQENARASLYYSQSMTTDYAILYLVMKGSVRILLSELNVDDNN